jgi:probable HAF family extracellular repeat protein
MQNFGWRALNSCDFLGVGLVLSGLAIDEESGFMLFQGFGSAAKVAAIVAVMSFSAGQAALAASFTRLGSLPGGLFDSHARSVSADGSVVVGYGLGVKGYEAFRWTEDDGMVGLGHLPGGTFGHSYAFGVSANSSVIIGTSSVGNSYEAFRWTKDDGMVGLGNFARSNYSVA